MAYTPANNIFNTGEENIIYISSVHLKDNFNVYNFEFKNYIKNFSDSYASNWSSQEIYNRMDPVYSYKNTTRKISIEFAVPSQTLSEAKANYTDINLLMDSLYPLYEEGEQNSRGTATILCPPLFRLGFVNLTTYKKDESLVHLLGWIDGITFKPELESGFFISGSNIFPKLYNVNFTFNVMHEQELGENKITPVVEQSEATSSDQTTETITPQTPRSESQSQQTDTVSESGDKKEWENDPEFQEMITSNLNIKKFKDTGVKQENLTEAEMQKMWDRWKKFAPRDKKRGQAARTRLVNEQFLPYARSPGDQSK